MPRSNSMVLESISREEKLVNLRKRLKKARMFVYMKYMFILFAVLFNALTTAFSIGNNYIYSIPYLSGASTLFLFISDIIDPKNVEKLKNDISNIEIELADINISGVVTRV